MEVDKPIHFAGLNGLRALAAVLVLFAHTTQALKHFQLNSMILGPDPNGNPFGSLLAGIGVTIFFAISGFLITYLLLEEKKIGINIRHFYIRRVLRIWPLYYLYMGLSLLTLWMFDLPWQAQSLWWYIFLMANVPFILGGAIQFIGHYWSLGVEEQFYAFWPWLIKKVSFKYILLVVSILFFCFFGVKVAFRLSEIMYGAQTPFYFLFITRFDCMMMGAAGAILYYFKNRLFVSIASHWSAQILAWLLIAFFVINKQFGMMLNHEIAAFATVLIIVGQIEKKYRLINFDNAVCDFLGKISFGIYVFHPLIIFYLEKIIGPIEVASAVKYILVYLSVFGFTILVAWVSYTGFEKKFLKLKSKFTIVKSSGSRITE